jgi:hypothetical protein
MRAHSVMHGARRTLSKERGGNFQSHGYDAGHSTRSGRGVKDIKQREYHRVRTIVGGRQAKIERETERHEARSRKQTLKENKRVIGQC